MRVLIRASALRTAIAVAAAAHGVRARPFSAAATPARPRRVLVTGAGGQIGLELVPLLRERLAHASGSVVVATDVRPLADVGGEFATLDVTDAGALDALVAKHSIDTVVHLASLLSAVGEKNPTLAMRVNRGGAEAVLEVAAARRLAVFAPSTIAAFGPSTPRDDTPDVTIMQPTTMYGVTKVYLEQLGSYYAAKFGVDFRSVRYPGVLSHRAAPGGGTTDYAVNIFYDALERGAYESFLGPASALPMMYMPDALAAAVGIMDAPAAALKQRVYNVTACSFTPAQLGAAISARLVAAGRPPLALTYKPDFRQAIADTWPRSIDDSNARRDWGWKHEFGMDAMVDDMLGEINLRVHGSKSLVKNK